MDDLLEQFLIEARELGAQAALDLSALLREPADAARIDSAFRAIHTLKGSVAIFDMAPAERALHAGEDVLAQARGGGRAMDSGQIEALVALLDQTDRWIDAMEQVGALPADSAAHSAAIVARLHPGATPAADWLAALTLREGEAIAQATGPLIAFRYTPDADCFFRGEDPLAGCALVPDLVALVLIPAAPWPALEDFEPFHCGLILEGLSRAGEAEVRAALRLMGDQVVLAPIANAAAPIEPAPAPGQAARSIRVDVARIDALADSVGELVIASNALSHAVADVARADARLGTMLRDAHGALERAVGDMRGAIGAVRMVPLGPSLQRLPRMVREIAATLAKPVRFTLTGEGVEVDKALADRLFEPLLHILRNALDHGIEDAALRKGLGKPAQGELALEITRDGDHVSVQVRDDGAGIDPARIRALAVERGLIVPDKAAAMDDAQAIRLIFAPGFSTAATVTSLSGRGVGMDAVRQVTEQLGGRVEVASTPGQGTTITLRLPLSAITTRLLVVRAGGQRYGVPLDRIVETASLPAARIMALGQGRACVLRGRTLPVLSLPGLLGAVEEPGATLRLLVTETGGERVGLVVDGFGERIDGLVRPRGGLLAAVPGLAGTTLTGDGGVLLVLDLSELIA